MHEAPENTLCAFRACLALGVGFEFDVRRTRDGQLVCLHDATLDRTTSGRGALEDTSLESLKSLDAGGWFDFKFADERVPTIEQIFKLVSAEAKGEILLAVDLKDSGSGLEQEVVRLASKHNVLQHLLFIGLTIESPEIRSRLKAANAGTRTARLAATASDVDSVLGDKTADWVYARFVPSAGEAARIHSAGKKIFIAGPLVAGYEAANWAAASQAQLDAILTDYPLKLAEQLRR